MLKAKKVPSASRPRAEPGPAFADIMVALLTYPDPTPAAAIEASVALAARLAETVTALAIETHLPPMRNVLANTLVGLDSLALEAEALSAARARDAARDFVAAAAARGLRAATLLASAGLYEEGGVIASRARTRDLTLLSAGPRVLDDSRIIHDALFGSGRPLLVFPEALPPPSGDVFARTAVAWDHSRCAARALADALPLLVRARSVRILSVTDEKPAVRSGSVGDVIRHLRAHGIEPLVEEVPAAGEPIGRVLAAYTAKHDLDLLVMGAYGHSRAREFVLGGATASMIEAPPCPVLLSH